MKNNGKDCNIKAIVAKTGKWDWETEEGVMFTFWYILILVTGLCLMNSELKIGKLFLPLLLVMKLVILISPILNLPVK